MCHFFLSMFCWRYNLTAYCFTLTREKGNYKTKQWRLIADTVSKDHSPVTTTLIVLTSGGCVATWHLYKPESRVVAYWICNLQLLGYLWNQKMENFIRSYIVTRFLDVFDFYGVPIKARNIVLHDFIAFRDTEIDKNRNFYRYQ